MYDRHGDHIDPRDVLDDQEYADYRNRRREEAHYRLARFNRTGRLPVSPREMTEEQALNEYERLVMGA